MIRPCFRGEVYYAILGCGMGSEQAGTRPVVILQNDVGNKFSPTTIIAPLSGQTATKAVLPTHYHVSDLEELPGPSVILLEQIRAIDKSRLGRRVGKLSEEHIRGINAAIKISLGLDAPVKNPVLCLYGVCSNQFYSTGFYALRRTDPLQVEKDMCTYCNRRRGYNYELIQKKGERK